MLTIELVTTTAAIQQARLLFEEYAAALQHEQNIDLSFQHFSAEVAGLPGVYAAPRGRLWLAFYAAELVGCCALRASAPGNAEMKRLYVRPAFRHFQVGRRLVETTIATARELGYERLLLDTLPTMQAARTLYAKLGFTEIPPYCHNPIPGTTFLELRLSPEETACASDSASFS